MNRRDALSFQYCNSSRDNYKLRECTRGAVQASAPRLKGSNTEVVLEIVLVYRSANTTAMQTQTARRREIQQAHFLYETSTRF